MRNRENVVEMSIEHSYNSINEWTHHQSLSRQKKSRSFGFVVGAGSVEVVAILSFHWYWPVEFYDTFMFTMCLWERNEVKKEEDVNSRKRLHFSSTR